MIEDSITDQIVDEVPAIEEVKVLIGLMYEPQAFRWFQIDYGVRNRWGPHLTEEEREEIVEDHKDDWLETYEGAKDSTADIVPFRTHDVALQDLPDDDDVQEHVDGFKSSDLFQETFQGVPDGRWELKLVPLNSLVAYQSRVTKEAHEEIPTSDDGWLDVVRYCLPFEVKNYLQVTEQGIPDTYSSLRIVSRSPNINFYGPELNSLEEHPPGNISVSYDIKARPNFIQVAKWNDRYILKNGYHRCYQLLQAGEEYVPAVVRYVQNYSQTGAAGAGMFPDQMIQGPRPPLVRDFLTDAAVTLEAKSRNKMIRLMIEKLDVEK